MGIQKVLCAKIKTTSACFVSRWTCCCYLSYFQQIFIYCALELFQAAVWLDWSLLYLHV